MSKIMKKGDIVNLDNALRRFNLKGVKFSYFVAKNLSLIKDEVNTIQSIKNKILEEVAEKDEKGKFVIRTDKKTGEKYHKVIDEKKFKKDNEEFEKLLKEPSKIKLFKIKLADIPNEISTPELRSIYDLIEEDNTK